MRKSIFGHSGKMLLLSLLLSASACQMQTQTTATESATSTQNSNSTKPSISTPDPTPFPIDKNLPPPISIKKVKVSVGKPETKMYSFNIKFNSRRDNFKWLLVQSNLNNPLVENGAFAPHEEFKIPFGGQRYLVPQTKEQVIIVDFYGDTSFNAIRPPAEGTIELNRWLFVGGLDETAFEVWEVKELLVNGKTPLEEWLPYDTVSTATSRPLDVQKGDVEVLDFEPGTHTPRTDYPKEKINTVVAQGIRKWNVPFKGISVD